MVRPAPTSGALAGRAGPRAGLCRLRARPCRPQAAQDGRASRGGGRARPRANRGVRRGRSPNGSLAGFLRPGAAEAIGRHRRAGRPPGARPRPRSISTPSRSRPRWASTPSSAPARHGRPAGRGSRARTATGRSSSRRWRRRSPARAKLAGSSSIPTTCPISRCSNGPTAVSPSTPDTACAPRPFRGIEIADWRCVRGFRRATRRNEGHHPRRRARLAPSAAHQGRAEMPPAGGAPASRSSNISWVSCAIAASRTSSSSAGSRPGWSRR